jgi:hypothetical protein
MSSMRKHRSKLGQQASDAVGAPGALLLEAFTQAVEAQHAVLSHGFDGHEMHLQARCCFADGCRVISIVFAAFALQPVGCY